MKNFRCSIVLDKGVLVLVFGTPQNGGKLLTAQYSTGPSSEAVDLDISRLTVCGKVGQAITVLHLNAVKSQRASGGLGRYANQTVVLPTLEAAKIVTIDGPK